MSLEAVVKTHLLVEFPIPQPNTAQPVCGGVALCDTVTIAEEAVSALRIWLEIAILFTNWPASLIESPLVTTAAITPIFHRQVATSLGQTKLFVEHHQLFASVKRAAELFGWLAARCTIPCAVYRLASAPAPISVNDSPSTHHCAFATDSLRPRSCEAKISDGATANKLHGCQWSLARCH